MLRSDVSRAGGQSEWARRAGIDRTYICKVLSGRKPPGPSIYCALGLESVILRDRTKSHVSAQEVLLILKVEIENAGNISRWCRLTVLFTRRSESGGSWRYGAIRAWSRARGLQNC